MQRLTKIFTIAAIALSFPLHFAHAADVLDIILKKDPNTPPPTQPPLQRPKAPAYVPVTCHYDGEALTFVSSYDTEAEIIVTDSFTSAVIAHETTQLTPEYTVSIAGAESFDITLTLEDGSILYGSY